MEFFPGIFKTVLFRRISMNDGNAITKLFEMKENNFYFGEINQ